MIFIHASNVQKARSIAFKAEFGSSGRPSRGGTQSDFQLPIRRSLENQTLVFSW